jgi:hypothetical protein
MARQAEAEREKRARIIAAEGESLAADRGRVQHRLQRSSRHPSWLRPDQAAEGLGSTPVLRRAWTSPVPGSMPSLNALNALNAVLDR